MSLQKDHIEARRPRRVLRRIALITAGLAVLILLGLLLMNSTNMDQLEHARRQLQAFDAWWRYVRWTFIAGLIIFWREINTWLAARNGWSEAHLQRVLGGRWLTLGVLLFVELFLTLRIHEPLVDRWLQ